MLTLLYSCNYFHRFKNILRFWHFNDNTNFNPDDPGTDKLHKVRKLADCLRNNCGEVFEPGKNVCVDESLLLFKGRLHFRQYIRTKRARYGVKFYELCTSDGILLDFVIYSGAGSFPEIPGRSSTETIVSTLMERYLHKGRCVYLDNYYTLPNLAKLLLENDTYMCGTVKPNTRQFPIGLANDAIEKNQSIFYKCDDENLLAVKYRAVKNKSTNQPKIVHLLSTLHHATTGRTGRKDKYNNVIMKPHCVIDYNHQMGGVDRMDQQLHSFRCCRKTYKWPKKVAIHLIMLGCLSACKVYCKHTGKSLPFLKFMHNVIAYLLTSSPKLNRQVLRDETVHRLTGRHFPTVRGTQEGGG